VKQVGDHLLFLGRYHPKRDSSSHGRLLGDTPIHLQIICRMNHLDAEALAELHGARWRVEQDLRDLKQTMGMDTLKYKSIEGVLKKLTAYVVVCNLARAVIFPARPNQGPNCGKT